MSRRGSVGHTTAAGNPFGEGWAAERYAAARPDVHGAMLAAARPFLEPRLPVAVGLDLACGTGLSTKALLELARRVVAIDLSPAMLAHAPRLPGAAYVRGRVEALPMATSSVNLAALGCAFHWCDAACLARELDRVLVPGGAALVYHNHFTGEIRECPGAPAWFSSVYRRRFPVPHRGPGFDAALIAPTLVVRATDRVEKWIALDLDQLVAYLTSHSSVIAAVRRGPDGLDAIEASLREDLERLCTGAGTTRVHCCFAGSISILERARDRPPERPGL